MTNSANCSLIDELAALPEEDLEAILSVLTPGQRQSQLARSWEVVARPEQRAPGGAWSVWVILAGRGFGKTRAGAEWVTEQVKSGLARRVALVAATAADARDTMVEGESGLLAVAGTGFVPRYEPSKRRVTWPNGAVGTTFTAEEPNRLRGPQHDAAWCDEIAAWEYPETWDMLMLGLRLGYDPRCVVTTTPKPRPFLRKLLDEPHTVVTRGSTYANLENLAPTFAEQVIGRYRGIRLERQELFGEYLEDVEGALWTMAMIDDHRVKQAPPLVRIVVGVDPAVTSGENADDTGIVVAGKGEDGHGYILFDGTCHEAPLGWAQRAIHCYHLFSADRIVAEVNNGGELVEFTLRSVDPGVPYHHVNASRGKSKRAEPISALYEQGRVHHVGVFAQLEAEMRTYAPDQPDTSPDRMDALVWAMTALDVKGAVAPTDTATAPQPGRKIRAIDGSTGEEREVVVTPWRGDLLGGFERVPLGAPPPGAPLDGLTREQQAVLDQMYPEIARRREVPSAGG